MTDQKSASEIDVMITELEELRNLADARKVEYSAAYENANQKEYEILAELEKQGLTSFKGNKGLVTISTRYSVKMPKDMEVKEQLRKALGDETFMALWSINHMSLNSWFKQRVEEAKVKNEYLDLPGLEPTSDKILSFRRAAK
jgi:hypothetical protein